MSRFWSWEKMFWCTLLVAGIGFAGIVAIGPCPETPEPVYADHPDGHWIHTSPKRSVACFDSIATLNIDGDVTGVTRVDSLDSLAGIRDISNCVDTTPWPDPCAGMVSIAAVEEVGFREVDWFVGLEKVTMFMLCDSAWQRLKAGRE